MAEPKLILRRQVAEPNLPLSMVLRGVPAGDTADSTVAEVSWRWEDEPDMKPQPLGKTAAGTELSVPFDLQGRSIRLFVNSRTEKGDTAAALVPNQEQKVFAPPTIPTLVAAEFDTGTDQVTLTIANNGGGGDINILRQIGSGGFALIATVGPAATSYVDSPAIDGSYQYKLTQNGVTGESNTRTVEVDVGSAGVGSPPSDLSALYDDVNTVTLTWTNNGGTGANVIERRMNGGSWVTIGSVASGLATMEDMVFPSNIGRFYEYRVRNESVEGYSNTADVYVPKW